MRYYLPGRFNPKEGAATMNKFPSKPRDRFAATLAILLATTALFASTPTLATPVVEFYNTNLDHYFITADAGEAAQIDGGSAGPGWVRTGNSFNSGGSSAVCRFYGSQNPGPNSHFYTVIGEECLALKQLQAITPDTEKRWNFESLDFSSTPPTNGTCLTGTTPVYRAYNNGWARGVDSNHRISSNPAAIQEVVNRGWINEGVVMCAPASDWWPPATITPMGVKVFGANQLPAGCNSWTQQCWKDAVANGTVKFIATSATMTGYNNRPVVFAYFRNTTTAFGVNGQWNFLPIYADDGSLVGSDISGGTSAEIDWANTNAIGIIFHDKTNGGCGQYAWDASYKVWYAQPVTCP